VLDTILALRGAGDRAMLVGDPEGELLRRLREGLDLVPLASRSDVDLAAAWRLSRVLKTTRPDIVHAHDSRGVALAATALAIAAPKPKPPLIAARRSEFRVNRSSFSRWKYSQVDWFIATSDTVRDRLVRAGVAASHVTVVTPGIDIERVECSAVTNVHGEFWLPTHAPIVGNVAALDPHKGHHHLVAAAARVVATVPDARFVIVGDGPLREQLERQIHHAHLERHIFLSGFREDVVEMTRGFDVYASAALIEGASMAILDAMASAKPIVASAAGSVSELVAHDETGFIVPPRDDTALARGIVTLLTDDGLRQRMGAAGRARAADRFSIERMTQDIQAVYARALRS
jgi:glycosyltransferase involved in cell wall biosynthesis